jgi:uroporphyrinogen-III synthase
MRPFVILSTKVLRQSVKELVARHGLTLLEHAFITVRTRRVSVFSESLPPVWVFTSRQGVVGLLENVARLRSVGEGIFCLSGSTQDEALTLNVPIVATAANAVGLAQLIVTHGKTAVTFFCGSDRRDELPRILKENGIRVEQVIVYDTIANPLRVKDEYDVALFFSPSAVESFFSDNALPKPVVCCCIGNTTAAVLRQRTLNPIVISPAPTQAAMAQTAIDVIHQNKPADA